MLIQLAIIQIITFVAIIFLLRFIFSRNLNSALGRLNQLHEENAVKENQLTEELGRAREERDAQIKKGKDDALLILEEAKKEAFALRLKIEADARLEAEKILAQGKEEIERFKKRSVQEMEEKSLKSALALAESVLSQESKEALQTQFLNEVIEAIGRLPAEKFPAHAEAIRIFTSHPLAPSQKERLENILKEKLGLAPRLEEVIKPDLICGLTLEAKGLLVEGNIRNRLERAVKN